VAAFGLSVEKLRKTGFHFRGRFTGNQIHQVMFEHPTEILTERICFLDLSVSPKKWDYDSLYKQYSWVEKDWGGHQMEIDLRELNWPVILHLSGRVWWER
jgi:hypothetical protein